MKRAVRFATLGTMLIVACRTSSTPDAKSGLPPRKPTFHRAVAAACPAAVPPPGYNSPQRQPLVGPYQCSSDADCKGTNARCKQAPRGNTYCTFDECMSDADCTGGKVCECDSGNNTCLPSGCRTDADCGAFACSPTRSSGCANMSGTVGYYCHGAKDECVDDGDCGGVTPMCVYDPAASHWTCNHSHCMG